jgi:hypothetical protein
MPMSVKMTNPETGEQTEFSLKEAQNIIKRQTKSKLADNLCWKLSDENFNLDSNGNIVAKVVAKK